MGNFSPVAVAEHVMENIELDVFVVGIWSDVFKANCPL